MCHYPVSSFAEVVLAVFRIEAEMMVSGKSGVGAGDCFDNMLITDSRRSEIGIVAGSSRARSGQSSQGCLL